MGNVSIFNWVLSALLLTILTTIVTSSADPFGDLLDWNHDGFSLPIVPSDITKTLETSGGSRFIEDDQAETLRDALIKSFIEELAEEMQRKAASKRRPTLRGIYCGNDTLVIQPHLIDEIVMYQRRAKNFIKGLLETYAASHSFASWDTLAARYNQSSDVALVPLLPELPSEDPSFYHIEVEKDSVPHPHHTKHKQSFDKGLFQKKRQGRNYRAPAVVEMYEGEKAEALTLLSLSPPLGAILQEHLRTVQFHTAAIEHVMLDLVLDGSTNPGVLRGLHRILSRLAKLSDQLVRTLRGCRIKPEKSYTEEVVENAYQRVDVDGALTRGVRTLRQTLKGLEYFSSCFVPIIK